MNVHVVGRHLCDDEVGLSDFVFVARERELDLLTALDRNTRQPRVNAAPIDPFSPLNENGMVNEPWAAETVTARAARLESDAALDSLERTKRRNDTLFLSESFQRERERHLHGSMLNMYPPFFPVIVGSCSVIGTVGLIAAAVFWYK